SPVFQRKALDIGCDAGRFSRIMHLIIRCLLDAEGDVLTDGVAEEECLLGYEANISAQRFQRVLLYRSAIDENLCGTCVIDARNQADKSALAGASRTDDRQTGASGNIEIHISQN